MLELNQDELQALANSILAPATQSRLDGLIAKNTENQLDDRELVELDRLLAQIDHLTLLKTRARYTLQSLGNLSQAS